jgi:hypothetical protein
LEGVLQNLCASAKAAYNQPSLKRVEKAGL